MTKHNPPPDALAHVAPLPSGDALGVVIIDSGNPEARGGSLRLSEATLRRLPALLTEAINRFDAQRAPRGEA